MIFMDFSYLYQLEYEMKRAECQAYDWCWMRGPMIEADIDWCAPIPYRQMVAGDIGQETMK